VEDRGNTQPPSNISLDKKLLKRVVKRYMFHPPERVMGLSLVNQGMDWTAARQRVMMVVVAALVRVAGSPAGF